jgi:hypothetical protein
MVTGCNACLRELQNSNVEGPQKRESSVKAQYETKHYISLPAQICAVCGWSCRLIFLWRFRAGETSSHGFLQVEREKHVFCV